MSHPHDGDQTGHGAAGIGYGRRRDRRHVTVLLRIDGVVTHRDIFAVATTTTTTTGSTTPCFVHDVVPALIAPLGHHGSGGTRGVLHPDQPYGYVVVVVVRW